MAMPGLGDILSAAATGQNQNQVTAGYQLNAARAADTFAQIPLRGAQTDEALAKASESRLTAIAAQKKQDAVDNAAQNAIDNGMDPHQAATLGQALATGSNFDQATTGMGHLQDQGYRATLASPTASGESQRLAAQGVKGELQSPYLALPPASVDARNLAPPGAQPTELDSNIGKATINQKDAAADAAAAKLTAGSPLDANDYAALAHLGNTTGHDPAFGMGASPARLTYLRARALDAQGLPITAASLGLSGGKATAAAPGAAAPTAALAPAAAADAVVQRQQDAAGARQTLIAFDKGVPGQKVTALNTSMRHLATFDEVANDLHNGNNLAANAVMQTWSKWSGNAAPTNADMAARVVGNEIVKAIQNSGIGAAEERNAMAANFSKMYSSGQLVAASNLAKQFLAGQAASMADQYHNGTGRNDFFDRNPLLRSLVPGAPPPARSNIPAPGSSGMPVIGGVSKGYRFKGGDPSQPASWEKVQ